MNETGDRAQGDGFTWILDGSMTLAGDADLDEAMSEEAKVIPLNLIRIAAVAAIFILLINVISLRVYTHSINTNTTVETQSEINYNQQLISNFKIYE